MGFADSLRMQGIFPGDRIPLGWQGKLPDFYGNKDPFEDVVGRVQNLQRGNISQIAQQVAEPQQQAVGRNASLGPRVMGPMTEYQQAQIQQRELDRASREAGQSANREIAQKRLGLSEWRAKNPNGVFREDENGEIIMLNPQTGEETRTGVKSANLPDAELQEIITQRQRGMESLRAGNRDVLQSKAQTFTAGQNQLDREARGWGNPAPMFDAQGRPQGMWQTNTLTGEQRKVSDEMMTRTTPPGTMALQPTQQHQAMINRVAQVRAQHPEWATFINPDTGAIAPVNQGWFGRFGGNRLDEATRQQIYHAIWDNLPTQASDLPPNASPTQAPVAQPPAQTPPPAQPPVAPPVANAPGNVSTVRAAPSHAPSAPTINDLRGQMQSGMGSQHPQPMPPIQDRIPGKVYILRNGQPARWTGSTWVEVQ